MNLKCSFDFCDIHGIFSKCDILLIRQSTTTPSRDNVVFPVLNSKRSVVCSCLQKRDIHQHNRQGQQENSTILHRAFSFTSTPSRGSTPLVPRQEEMVADNSEARKGGVTLQGPQAKTLPHPPGSSQPLSPTGTVAQWLV